MKKVYSRILPSILALLLFIAFSAEKFYSQTAVYDINSSGMLVNMSSSCGNGSYYNGCSGTTGFNFTASLPGGATITSVVLQLSVGVECQNGTRSTTFNNVGAPSFNTNNHCNCSGTNNGIFTLNLNPGNFVANGQNQFRIINPPSCFGLYQYNNSLYGSFARVTVNYTTGPPSSPSSVTPDYANSCPNAAVTLTAGNPIGTVYWFTSGCNTSGQIATGNPITVNPASTTTYYARNYNGGLWSNACASTTVTVAALPTPTTNNVTINCGQTATLTAANGTGTYYWYSDQAGTQQVGTGASFTTPALSANTTYYVGTSTGQAGCNSNIVPATVTVNSNIAQPVITGNTTVTCGNTTTLTSSSGNNTAWYNAAANGTLLGTGATYTTPALTANSTVYAFQSTFNQGTVTFNYTGGVQTWTVPVSGTYSFDLYGGRGGNVTSYYVTAGGLGGRAQGQISLSAGQVVYIYVGGQGQDRQGNHPYGSCTLTNGGWNGGGANRSAGNGTPGGGASDIRIGGNGLNNRYIVAGGGGGCGWTYATGGAGGGLSGAGGANGTGGGTQNAGGNVGNSGGGCGQSGGSLGQGGDGSGSSAGGGGGGGGYYGGGGGGYNQGGGGGSSYYGGAGVTNGSTQTGVRNGDGQIIITWSGVGCSSQPVSINISVNLPAAPTASNLVVSCGATASLTATGGGGNGYQWYTNQAGTAYVGSGSPFVSPALTANTTYYVVSSSGQAGGTAYTFTNAGATGMNGPNQGQLNAAYAGTNLNGLVTTTNGIQLWTVPATGAYTIEAFGAQGGGANNYGKGSQIKGTFQLTAGQQIKILVGQSGGYYGSGSGGGGSFVTTSANVPLVVAGGGGGQYDSGSQLYNAHSVVGNNGQATGCTAGGTAGAGGNGCNNSGAAGGGGLSSNGGNGSYGTGGISFVNGGTGGNHASQAACVGGFGGGGGTHGNTGGGGGGGGYSGGGGGFHDGNTGAGGGGGSYNAGTSPINVGGVRVGHGQVIITVLSSPCVSATVPVIVTVNAVTTPTVSNQTINCGQTATLTASTNSPTVTWYSNAQGTTTVGSGASWTTPQLLTTTTYYVNAGPAGACATGLVAATVTVNVNIAQPVITGNTTVTCGNTTTLTSSTGANTAWYNAAANGTLLGTGGTYTTPSLTTNTAVYAIAAAINQGTQTFNYTGSQQTWTVPAGVYSINVDAQGAQGGASGYGNAGLGGRIQATIPVTPGQTLYVNVGGAGSNAAGWNGGGTPYGCNCVGGGGGATDIRIGGTALSDRNIVAGGGGGAGYYWNWTNDHGGHGGGTTGEAGKTNNGYNPSYCGQGGTPSAGGAGATQGGPAGSLGQGGGSGYYAGSGGGGYYGGGSGYAGGGGGGGSSYAINAATAVTHTQGFKSSNGLLTISWNAIGCASQPVTINVSVNLPAAPTASNVVVACGATASLTATGGGGNGYQWYSNQAGTAYVGSGSPFVSPSLNANTTYYVASSSGQAGGTTYTFTNASATGMNGPNQGQLNAAYAGTNLNGLVTTTNGIQLWTVPASGAYTIEAFGAQGGGANNYGKGSQIKGTFQLTAGQQIKILVGQSGGYYGSGSGGGGSFVTTSANVPLLIAGGGGGQYDSGSQLYNAHSVVGNNGQPTGCTTGGTAGAGGNGCNNNGASGGGGLNSNGGNGSYGTGGQSFISGGVGGNHSSQAACVGGFGGGGGTHGNTGGGGGGGGYSGGAGGFHDGNTGSGGGGGSFNGGTSPINVGGVRVGHGQVIITVLSSPCVSATVPVVVTVNAVTTPTVTNQTINCGQTVTLTASTNSPTVTWYSNAQGTTTVGSGASWTSPQLTATTTYYVNAGPAGACATGLVAATVTVNALTNPTASAAAVTCGQTATVTASGGGGNTITWYSNANGSGALGTGASFTTPVLASNTTYYITTSAGGNAGGSYTFTNASATGRTGPTQGAINSAYAGTSLANTVTIATQGIQEWVVPTSGNYRILTIGAQGGGAGNGGLGASVQGDFALTAGQKLFIVVGQQGLGAADGQATGGGGGSFVATGNATYTTATPLIVAGGGGGASPQAGYPGLISTNGGAGEGCQAGGTNGNGGADASSCGSGTGGAGGFYTDGASGGSWGSQRGYGFRTGAALGGTSGYNNREGGFGGGGGTHGSNTGGGPGGGYSGGSAPNHGGNWEGGGGGSFNGGTNPVATQGVQSGMGSVVITSLAAPCVSGIVAVPVTVNAIQAPTVSGTTAFCSGAAVTTTLTAAGSPSGYTWWTNSNGTGQLGTTAAFTTPSINATTTYYVQSTSPNSGSQTFNYTGAVQTFTAPVTGNYTFDANGAQGGVTAYAGGLGGRVQGILALTAGQTINIYVGQQPTTSTGGWNGGGNSGGNGIGGGGASDIRVGGNGLNNRVIVAAGGGGGGFSSQGFTGSNGAFGGGTTGGTSTQSNGGWSSGTGGTQGAGGTSSGCCGNGTSGSLGLGGNGGNGMSGCGSYSTGWGGGGGGGYYGGGGGSNCGGGVGGGGGSSYFGGAGVTNGTTTAGVRNGNGQIILTWTGTGCASAVTPVTVTLAAAVAANAGADVTSNITCGKDIAQLSAAALANGETGVWTITQGAGAALPGLVTAPGANATTFQGSYGGTYTLTWTVTNAANCTSTDNMIVTFNQPNAASLGGLIGPNDVLWNGLSTSDWSTSNNWYEKQAAGHYVRMTSGQPASNTEVFTISNAVGGMCIGNNMPTLSVTSNAEDVYVNTGMSLNLTNDIINLVGNLTNYGTINASTGTINFTGGLSSLISGSGTTSLNNLTVNKSGGQALTVSMPVTVTGVLDMTLGNIFTSTNGILTLGNSSAVPGTLSWTSGNIVGPFRRYFINGATSGNAGLFPVGTAAFNRYAQVNFTSTPGVNQYLTVWYKLGAPLTPANIPLYNGLPLTTQDNQLVQNYSADGYWNVDPTASNYTSSITSAPYSMTLYANNLNGMVTPMITRIIKAPGSNSAQNHHVQWQGAGVHTPIAGGTSPVAFAITSTSMQGFSWFNIGTSNNQALPVELLSFSGTCASEQVDLTWQTASEHNSLSFELEKSRDGEVWSVINTQAAAGNSTQLLTYTYSDKMALEGNNYYRLSQYDIDGASKVYDVINVNCSGNSKGYFSTYPNPTTGAFQVVLNNKELVGTSVLNIMDTKGSSILHRAVDVKSGINLFSVQDLQLAPGIYYISITNGDKTTEVIKQSIR